MASFLSLGHSEILMAGCWMTITLSSVMVWLVLCMGLETRSRCVETVRAVCTLLTKPCTSTRSCVLPKNRMPFLHFPKASDLVAVNSFMLKEVLGMGLSSTCQSLAKPNLALHCLCVCSMYPGMCIFGIIFGLDNEILTEKEQKY